MVPVVTVITALALVDDEAGFAKLSRTLCSLHRDPPCAGECVDAPEPGAKGMAADFIAVDAGDKRPKRVVHVVGQR